jgi:signal transduction histidine kinase
MYLVIARPVLVGLGLIAVAATAKAEPTVDTTYATLMILALAALEIPYLLAAHRWARTELIVLVALVIDTLVQVALLVDSQSPVASSAALVLPLMVLGYFAPTVMTIAFGAGLAALMAIMGPRLDGWNDTATIPSISYALFGVSIAIAVIARHTRSTERELERVVAEQRLSLDRMRQLDRARDRLIANVSHELRTPLTSTIGAVETLLREDVDLPDDQRLDLLLIARRGGLRLLGLVEDLLTIGSTRPDSLQLHLGTESLVQLVRDSVEGIDLQERPLEIVAAADSIVSVDRLRMMQVVTNLVVNAVRHGSGAIQIEISATRRHAEVRVFDEGNGVAPVDIDELFLPFARFSQRTDSTGLGLAICRSIVDAHDGTLTYERTRDGRTCFHLELQLEHSTSLG